jgi:hypothetical protein
VEETRSYSFISNASINNIDYLGLNAAKDHAVDNALSALDTVTSGTKANKAVKALMLLKKIIDGRKKLKDPATQKKIKEIEKDIQRFINEPTFQHCFEACRNLVDYLECDILRAMNFCHSKCTYLMTTL